MNKFNKYFYYIILILGINIIILLTFSCVTSVKKIVQPEKKEKNVKVIIISPENGEKVYKKLKVNYFVQNLDIPIKESRLYIDNKMVSIKKEGEFSFLVNIDFLNDKQEYNIQISIIDDNGKEYKSSPVKIVVDSDIPQFLLLTDIDKKTISESIILDKEIIAKNNFNKLEIYIDGKLYKIINDINSEIKLNPEDLGVGEHSIYFKIYDKQNNVKQTSISKFTIKNREEKAESVKSNESSKKNENTDTNKNNENTSKANIDNAMIIFPENYSGVLDDYLKVILKNAKGLYLEVSRDPDFKNLLVKIKIENSMSFDLKNINKTDIYYIRLNDGNQSTKSYIVGFIKNNFVKIDSTEYIMGTDEGIFGSEKPAHKVALKSFYISRFEITKREFEIFLLVTGYKTTFRFKRFSRMEYQQPITNVTWYDAKAFCSWLKVRLPYEAEWEFVAKTKHNYLYSWGNDGIKGNLKGAQDGYPSLAPVNAYEPNEFGIYNLSGNVWEWCEDWYNPNYYSISSVNNPKGPPYGTSKVIRGGSYKDNLIYLRTTTRGAINPYSTLDNVGFRIAKYANE